MRPYLAIITDSFRAAFASRVLWMVLAAITLLLVVLAPIGFREVYTVDFSRGDLLDPQRMTGTLAAAAESDEASAVKNIFLALPEDLRTAITQASQSSEPTRDAPQSRQYAKAFTELTKTDDWYDPALWEGTIRLSELRTLDPMDGESMDQRLRQRRARLRIEGALPRLFVPRPERSLLFTYAWLETPLELPWRLPQFIDVMNQYIFPTILNLLLGVGAVFVGVLVTSPIIPEMFQPGSLHLLLSKPISRPALYIAKFVGGCAFVFLCVTLLVVGLWLIAGLRLGIWNYRFFYTIPVFVILFAVYYSVSALAGLHFRSAVVSVIVTVLFWLACFIVVQAGGIADTWITGPAKLKQIVPGTPKPLVVTALGSVQTIDMENSQREVLLPSTIRNRVTILGLEVEPGSGGEKILVARNDTADRRQFKLCQYGIAEPWEESDGIDLPAGTSRVTFLEDGGLIASASSGLYAISAAQIRSGIERQEEAPATPKRGGLLSGLSRLLSTPPKAFSPILPATIPYTPRGSLVVLPGRTPVEIALASSGNLYRLAQGEPDQPWSLLQSVTPDGDSLAGTLIAATKNRILFCRDKEPSRIYDAETFEQVGEFTLPENATVLSLHSDPHGPRILGVLSDQRVFQVDLEGSATLTFPAFPGQGRIEGIAWGDQGQLWVTHDVDRLSRVDVATKTIVQQAGPQRDLWRNIDAWVITPLRTILPQTGEVGEAVIALVSDRRDLLIGPPEENERQRLDVVRPLVTCGAFTLVMLFFGSLYVYRQDF